MRSCGGGPDHVQSDFAAALLRLDIEIFENVGGQVVFHRAAGMRALEPERSPLREDTIFDLASLTKVVATATSRGLKPNWLAISGSATMLVPLRIVTRPPR